MMKRPGSLSDLLPVGAWLGGCAAFALLTGLATVHLEALHPALPVPASAHAAAPDPDGCGDLVFRDEDEACRFAPSAAGVSAPVETGLHPSSPADDATSPSI
ncbi:hypothetical protein SL003B_2220 [Polymorphum gilvum SL003B-26A1]|uniref:Uncharacterized protein n=2 Tax=Polymorphum TaxID=991903 RepID=F2IZR9_POLGS|nr:hypothetical protein SL003B_2220 [Polymorphum gilvum SL003B-26A1]